MVKIRKSNKHFRKGVKEVSSVRMLEVTNSIKKRVKPKFFNCFKDEEIFQERTKVWRENRPRKLIYDDDQDTDEELLE